MLLFLGVGIVALSELIHKMIFFPYVTVASND